METRPGTGGLGVTELDADIFDTKGLIIDGLRAAGTSPGLCLISLGPGGFMSAIGLGN